MRFSVIVPVYESEKYLRECIESVLNQSFNDLELVLVDDGSTDASAGICDEYAADARVKVIHKENGGQFSARVCAIGAAEGEYIVPLDADDTLRHDALEVISSYINRADADIVIFNCSRKPGYDIPHINYPFDDGKVYCGESKIELYETLAKGTKLNSFCLKAYSADLLHRVEWDSKFIEGLRNGEDLMQFLPVITEAERIVFCNRILYYYRPNEMSASSRYKPSLYNDRHAIYEKSVEFFEIWGLDPQKYTVSANRKFLRNVVSIVKTLGHEERKCAVPELKRISTDEWGRGIYRSSSLDGLPFSYKLILKLLYNGRCGILYRLLRRVK